MLAFSSIAQLGMMFIAFSIPGEAGIIAGLAIGLHHMLVKPSLFLLASRWGGSVNALAGAGLKSPVAAAIFVLLALSAIGVPPLPGFWAKMLLLMPLAEHATNMYLLTLMVVLLAVVFEVGYLLRVVSKLYQRPDAPVEIRPHHIADVSTAGALSGMLLLVVVLLPATSSILDVMAGQVADVALYIQTIQPASLLAGVMQ
jgi:formate hydrogenlyase subunit 3/multisubunit Na+/H+ antiporter MnhD subunit